MINLIFLRRMMKKLFLKKREEFNKQMELEQRPFVSWYLSKCCKNISESVDIIEKVF